MCGVAGITGLQDADQKLKMVVGLGSGIDRRGGHAAGYVSYHNSTMRVCKKLGRWMKAKQRFINSAAEGELCMMHARFATCGDKEKVDQAHPYAIKRNGQIALWGCHNGTFRNAWESAKKNNRHIDVDSQEIFELLADKDYQGIRDLNGYGVITWIEPNNRNRINVVKLSHTGELCIVKLKEGGMAWASTWDILKDALKLAGLATPTEYKDLEVGRVYQIAADGLYKTDLTGIKVGDPWKSNTTTYSRKAYDLDNDDDDYGYGHWGYNKTDTKTATKTEANTTPTTHSSGWNGFIPQFEGRNERLNGDVEYYKNKILHREDGPARITKSGDEEWFKNGLLHRIGGPAVKKKSGTQEWWLNGQRHREDGPAIIKDNGDKEWYFHNEQHRVGGPAIEKKDGYLGYYQNGKLHREDGPAISCPRKTGEPYYSFFFMGHYQKDEEALKRTIEYYQEMQEKEKTKQEKNNAEALKLDQSYGLMEDKDKEDQESAMDKDGAFLRELRLLHDKFESEDEKKREGDPDESRYLLKGLQ